MRAKFSGSCRDIKGYSVRNVSHFMGQARLISRVHQWDVNVLAYVAVERIVVRLVGLPQRVFARVCSEV